VEAALALGDRDRAEHLLATVAAIAPGLSTPFLRAHTIRFRARLADTTEHADDLFASAADAFRDIGFSFYLAVTLLEHAELLTRVERPEGAVLRKQAREIFEQLGATVWISRAAGQA
jgi:hypothetical protein